MVDYMVLTGGGWPDPRTPWALFLAAVRRRGRYSARSRLELMDSVTLAISQALGGGSDNSVREELVAEAYPLKRASSRFWANIFAGDEADG